MKNTIDKINNYLQVGGMFNPELMEHHKVSDLLLECREQLMKAQKALKNITLPHMCTSLQEARIYAADVLENKR